MDRWYQLHKFDEHVEQGKTVAPVKLIFVFDGKIDACKIARNFSHDERQRQLDVIKREIVSTGQNASPSLINRSTLTVVVLPYTHT